MATHGITSEPTSTAAAYSGSLNHFCIPISMPAGGPWRVTRVAVWAAGYGASPSARTAIWRNDTGAKLGESASFTLTSRAFSSTGSDLYDKALATPTIPLAGGFATMIGFAISPLTSGAFFGQFATGFYRAVDAGTFVSAFTGYTTYSTGALGAYVTYEASNSAPNAPTALTPTGGVIITGSDLTPALAFLYDDPDGDPMSAYQVQVSKFSDFSSFTDGWDSGKVALVQADSTTVIVSPSSSLLRGTLYYWRARVYDDSDAVSGWSA